MVVTMGASSPATRGAIARWDLFAVAIAARVDRLRLIDEENGSWESAWPADEPQGAYAVYIADSQGYRTLALDFDVKRGDAATDSEKAWYLLAEAGVEAVRVRSGPSGGFHVLATFTRRVRPQRMKTLGRCLQVAFPSLDTAPIGNPKAGCIRPPGSPHRVAGRSEVIGNPSVALRTLQEGNGPNALLRLFEVLRRRVGTPYGVSALEKEIRTLSAASVGNRNTSLNKSAYSLGQLVAGGELERGLVRRRLYAEALGVGLGPVEASRTITSGLSAGAKHPRVRSLHEEIEKIRALVRALPWRGRGGNTDYTMLKAHLVIAERAGNLEGYNASKRELVELARVTGPTVIAANRRLQKAGWLERLPVPRPIGHAATYSLRIPISQKAFLTTFLPTPPKEYGQSQGSDAFRWRALGHAKGRLYELLCERDTWALPDLAKAYGAGQKTVRAHLSRLAEYKLAEHDSEGGWKKGTAELVDVARVLGIENASHKQQLKHDGERLAFADFHRKRRGVDWRTGEILKRSPSRSNQVSHLPTGSE